MKSQKPLWARGYTISSSIRMLMGPLTEEIRIYRPRSKKRRGIHSDGEIFLARRWHQLPREYWAYQNRKEGEMVGWRS